MRRALVWLALGLLHSAAAQRPPDPPPNQASCGTVEEGSLLLGTSLRVAKGKDAPDLAACRAACAAEPQCYGFTFIETPAKQDTQCQLKRAGARRSAYSGEGTTVASEIPCRAADTAADATTTTSSSEASAEKVVVSQGAADPECYWSEKYIKGSAVWPHERSGAGIASPRHCQLKCQAHLECHSWTLHYEEGCLMWEEDIDVDTDQDRVINKIYSISGPKYCNDTAGVIGGCLEESCEYPDNSTTVIEYTNIATPWRCQFTCMLTDNCTGFSFDYEETSCALKKELLEAEKVLGGDVPRHKVCGPKTCDMWPASMKNSIYQSTPMEDYIDGLLAKMTTEQKIGQMVLTPDAFYSPEAQLEAYQVNVLWGPGYKLDDPITDLQKHFDAIYYLSASDAEGTRPAIPSIVAVDAVHGAAMAKGSTMFPHNIGLGCANDTALMKRIGLITAIELTAVGADWTLAPMTAVTMDVRWGRTFESFSMDGFTVSRLAEAFLLGLQGDPTDEEDFLRGRHVPGMCKHFLADGAPMGGFTDGDADIDEEELIRVHAEPFKGCMRAGMVTTMPSFNDVNGWEMHQNGYLLNDVLKGKLGFDGVVLSDWNAHQQINGCVWDADDCPIAVNAGVDMFLIAVGGGSHWTSFVEKTLARVTKTKDITEDRINDAAKRILRMKARMGLIGPSPTRVNPAARPGAAEILEVMGNPRHLAIAQDAVRKSAVLLKNNPTNRTQERALPLKGDMKVLLAGKGEEKYLQLGAWSLDWQGQEDDELLEYASSLKDALTEHLTAGGGSLTFDADGEEANDDDFDAIILVMAEHPYAEVEGDLMDLSLMHKRATGRTNNFGKELLYKEDWDRLVTLRSKAPTTPVIIILYTGRPLYVNAELNMADAFISAWLPGTMAGEGLVDLIFRRDVATPTLTVVDGEEAKETGGTPAPADFTAKLSFNWPAHPCQSQGAVGDGQIPLFPFGHGLSYAAMDKDSNGTSTVVGVLDEVDLDLCKRTECWDLDCNLGQYVGTNNQPVWLPQTND